jgi:hypothetical protein
LGATLPGVPAQLVREFLVGFAHRNEYFMDVPVVSSSILILRVHLFDCMSVENTVV